MLEHHSVEDLEHEKTEFREILYIGDLLLLRVAHRDGGTLVDIVGFRFANLDDISQDFL